MEKVEYVEQATGSEIITIFTEFDHQYHIAQSVLENFIELQGLNIEYEHSNSSPQGDNNPEWGIEEEIISDPSDFLDGHLYQVCELYINDKQVSTKLKHVA